ASESSGFSNTKIVCSRSGGRNLQAEEPGPHSTRSYPSEGELQNVPYQRRGSGGVANLGATRNPDDRDQFRGGGRGRGRGRGGGRGGNNRARGSRNYVDMTTGGAAGFAAVDQIHQNASASVSAGPSRGYHQQYNHPPSQRCRPSQPPPHERRPQTSACPPTPLMSNDSGSRQKGKTPTNVTGTRTNCENLGEIKFGYFVSCNQKSGSVSYIDDPSAHNGVQFDFDIEWVKQLGIQPGDRLRYQIPRDRESAENLYDCPYHQDLLKVVFGFIKGEEEGDIENEVTYIVAPPDAKRLRIPATKTQFGVWKPQKGDQVKVLLNISNSSPSSYHLSLERPTNRSSSEVFALIESLPNRSSSDEIAELVLTPAVWLIVGQWTEFTPELLLKVLAFFVRACELTSPYLRSNLNQSMSYLFENFNCKQNDGPFFELLESASQSPISHVEMISTIIKFCELFVRVAPEQSHRMLSVCEQFYAKIQDSGAAFRLATILCKKLTTVPAVDLSWYELPVTMRHEELCNSEHSNFCTNYECIEQYLDINLRRLRAHFFENIKSNVSQFIRNPRTSQAQSIYWKVRLVGIDITSTETSLLVELKPFNGQFKGIKNSPRLLFGTLLCLSFDETFTDIFWATVSGRDVNFFEKSGLVLIELCSDADSGLCNTALLCRLHASSGTVWLAEAETFAPYQAYKAVFNCLQSLRSKPIPLEKPLLESTFNSIPVTCQIEAPKIFDPSQVEAYNSCLRCNVSVVSGPSGSGKTLFTAHLVSALSRQQNVSDPVLLLTNQISSLKHAVSKLTDSDSSLKVRLIAEPISLEQFDDKAAAAKLTELSKAKEFVCSHLKLLLELENVEFNEQFLTAYWSEDTLQKFISGTEAGSIEASLNKWMPSPTNLESIWMSSLRMEEAATNVKPTEMCAESTTEPSKYDLSERFYAPSSKEMRRKFVETKLQIHFSKPSGLKFERRLTRLTSTKWRFLKHVTNPWDIDLVEERYFYIQGCMLDYIEQQWAQAGFLDARLADVARCQEAILQLTLDDELKASRESDVVAMTITGACANLELLQKVRPSAVVVDEASVIPEPMLLGCLGDWARRVYLIGDLHQVDSKTVSSFRFDERTQNNVSMMERLVNSGFPQNRLKFQNRMHPDISKYLKLDVWPDVKDNLNVVSSYKRPEFMQNSVVFWDLRNVISPNRESSDKELAELVAELALVYLNFGFQPNNVTILTSSTSQVRRIKGVLLRVKNPQQHDNKQIKDIEVCTVVDYQGRENDIVIVQLMNGNNDASLPLRYLRYISQTRARCALVFIGFVKSVSESADWKPFIEALKNDEALDCNFPVVCNNHNTKAFWRSISDLRKLCNFCFEDCSQFLPCGEHTCSKKCHPWHRHDQCSEEKTMVLPCGHTEITTCSNSYSTSGISCKRPCDRLLPCGHKCPRLCAEQCNPSGCTTTVSIELPCGHMVDKACNEPTPICSKSTYLKLDCGHSKEILCVANRANTVKTLKCKEPCIKFLPCKHRCGLQCHEVCSSVPCPINVQKQCASCNQLFTSKCGDNKLQCNGIIRVTIPSCGHRRSVKCSLKEQEILKQCVEVCGKRLSCGHNCDSPCGVTPCPPCGALTKRDNCDHIVSCWELQSDCIETVPRTFKCGHLESMTCGTASRRVDDQYCSTCWPLAIQRRKAKLAVNSTSSAIKRTQLSENNEETSVEYFKVHDRVMRYIKSEHGISVQIQSIERIENPVLDRRMFNAYEDLFKKDCSPELFFHGTKTDAAEAIIRDGFRVGQSGMYGAGIYFATDTTKSAQYCRESGIKSLLLCEVLLGKSMVCNSPNNGLSLASVKAAGYDSVFAKRGTKNTRGVMNDEYIVYRAEQAAPRYLIRFT
ncbi:hypothetical protein BOX15_Mlig030831g1, partial [Macrostomum lignano]